MTQWIIDHAALLAVIWPVATALFSLLYTQIEALPRVHAALSILASLGIDLPKLWDALGRLFVGQSAGRGGPGGGPTAAATLTPSPNSPASKKDSGSPMQTRGRLASVRARRMFPISAPRFGIAIGSAALMLCLCGCPQATSAIVPALDLAICVEQVDQGEPAGTSVEKVVVDATIACGGDAAQILRLLTAARKAGAHHAPPAVCK